jgi:hypothetical protein
VLTKDIFPFRIADDTTPYPSLMNQIPLRSQINNAGRLPTLSLAPTIGDVSGIIGQQQQSPSSLGAAQRDLGLSQISWEGRRILLPQSQLAPLSDEIPVRTAKKPEPDR